MMVSEILENQIHSYLADAPGDDKNMIEAIQAFERYMRDRKIYSLGELSEMRIMNFRAHLMDIVGGPARLKRYRPHLEAFLRWAYERRLTNGDYSGLLRLPVEKLTVTGSRRELSVLGRIMRSRKKHRSRKACHED